MASIAWIDPAYNHIGNSGDEIIGDSVWRELKLAAKDVNIDLTPSMVKRTSSHHKITHKETSELREARFVLVGGTNLLQSDMRKWRQWKIGYRDVRALRGLSLCGVGWWQYGQPLSMHTTLLLNAILRTNALHSVRDNFTRSMLTSMGIRNVINTCCPTLWECTDSIQSLIPTKIAENCVTCLTDYNRSHEQDRDILQLLSKLYRKVYFWPQCSHDRDYAQELISGLSNFRFLEKGVQVYHDFLSMNDGTEFVGTRLHGGIRAMQLGKRVTIIGIDNRAVEIGRDTGLNVIERGDIASLKNRLTSEFRTRVQLPWTEIERYRSYLRERISACLA